jgi:integrase
LPVARIAAYDVNELVKAMLAEGYAPATIRIELALLSALFKTTEVWEWGKLPNVAHAVRWPSARGSARDRTLSADEEQRLAAALLDCRNPLVASFVWFAIETAVRKSEGLLIARWQDLDENCRTLKLVEAKMGPRKVPLTRAALAILQALPRGGPEERIFPLSPEALDAAWTRACKRAGIENLHIHDLRHTAATRYAKRLHGDIFLLQLITGHRSLSQLRRYVNPTVEDVVRAFDATEGVG